MIIIILICLGSLEATSRHCQLVHCVFRRGSLVRGSPNRILFMICMNSMRSRQLIACITMPDIDAREQNHRERVLNGAVPARVRSSSTACVNKHTCTHTRMQRHKNTGMFLSCMAPKGTVKDAIDTGHGCTTQSCHFLYFLVTVLLITNNQGP